MSDAGSAAARPLDGVLVVAVEQAVAAPLATRRLADAGARVVKIERPEGDFARGYDAVVHGESAYFVWLNRGKESLVLDFKAPDDAALLDRILARADVFVQNLSPGAAARAGFGAEALRARHPRLITCDVSGYGEEGAFAHMRAYDQLVQGEAGLIAVTGSADAPARVGISICDIAAGMHAHAAVVEALLLRERTGRGSAVRVSLFDAMADWMSVPFLYQAYGGGAPARTGLHHPSIAPYGAFRTADGGLLLVSVQNEREWVRFCVGVLGRPELADDPRFASNTLRVANRAALDGVVQETFERLPRADLVARLLAEQVAFGQVRSVAELVEHPALRRTTVATPSGPVSLPAEAVAWGAGGADRAVPALGAHDRALRAEFGDDTAPA